MIKLSPDELRDYAKKLRANSEEAVALASSIGSNIEAVCAGWEGLSKDKYAETFEEIRPILTTKLPEMIEVLATNLETKADNFEAADET